MSYVLASNAAPTAAPAFPVSCFSVVATAEVDVMARVLGVFAKRGILPDRWYSSLAGSAGEALHIDVQVGGLDQPAREHIARSLRQIVEVETVLTSEKRHALSA